MQEHLTKQLEISIVDIADRERHAFKIASHSVENHRQLKVIVIGVGYSGIYLGIRIPERLRNVGLTIYEKNEDVSGTWWENRYVGAACDTASHSYQYKFGPNPSWSSFYAPSRETREYLDMVAEKYGAKRFIKLQHNVLACQWDNEIGKRKVKIEDLKDGKL
jgi:cation diffusion facilitator CzcD-associated flavoprotein CzcO